MLGHPALVARHRAGDAQREALLAQQRVAAVAGAHAPDQPLLGEVDDVAALGREVAGGVQPGHELVAARELVQRDLAHARHHPHVGDDVRAVGDLDADLAERRSRRPHHVGHDVHRPALHHAFEERAHAPARLVRRHPVVGRPGVFLAAAGDEGQVLGAGDVAADGCGGACSRGPAGDPGAAACRSPAFPRRGRRFRPASRRTRPRGKDAWYAQPRRPTARLASCEGPHLAKACEAVVRQKTILGAGVWAGQRVL